MSSSEDNKKEKEVDPVGSMEAVSDDTTEVDKLLSEANPNYEEAIKDIGPELSHTQIIIESIDFSNAGQFTDLKELSRLQKIKLKVKNLIQKGYTKFAALLISLKYLVLAFLTEFPKLLIGALKGGVHLLKSAFGTFKEWHWKKKIIFIMTFTVLGAVGFVYFKMVKQDKLDQPDFPFLGSFEETANFIGTFDPDHEMEPFYHSARIKIYAFELAPFFVNLKRPQENQNSMAMIHLVFEGNNREILIELKEKESQFRDLVQRELETYSFDDLDSVEGKKELLANIKELFNQRLNSGEIRAVQFKNIILKY